MMSLLNNKETIASFMLSLNSAACRNLPVSKVFSIALIITMSSKKKKKKKSHSQVKNTKRRTFCLCSPKRTLAVSESQ